LCRFGLCAAGKASAGNWKFFASVVMHDHGIREVVNLLEQLSKLSKAKVIPGIRLQIKMN